MKIFLLIFILCGSITTAIATPVPTTTNTQELSALSRPIVGEQANRQLNQLDQDLLKIVHKKAKKEAISQWLKNLDAFMRQTLPIVEAPQRSADLSILIKEIGQARLKLYLTLTDLPPTVANWDMGTIMAISRQIDILVQLGGDPTSLKNILAHLVKQIRQHYAASAKGQTWLRPVAAKEVVIQEQLAADGIIRLSVKGQQLVLDQTKFPVLTVEQVQNFGISTIERQLLLLAPNSEVLNNQDIKTLIADPMVLGIKLPCDTESSTSQQTSCYGKKTPLRQYWLIDVKSQLDLGHFNTIKEVLQMIAAMHISTNPRSTP